MTLTVTTRIDNKFTNHSIVPDLSTQLLQTIIIKGSLFCSNKLASFDINAHKPECSLLSFGCICASIANWDVFLQPNCFFDLHIDYFITVF